MTPLNIEALSKAIQFSLLPVVLISGVGLLLLSLTNRLARTIDRSRELSKELIFASDTNTRDQLRILYRRCKHLQASIALASASVLFSSTMIIGFFVLVMTEWAIQSIIVGFFLVSVVCLILSMLFFIRDIFLALKALDLSVSTHLD